MCKIDKEKLLKELTDWHVPEQIINIVEAVPEDPEEQEIDFDALYDEWAVKPMDWSESRGPYDQARSFCDFLKSKNLTVPEPKQIPVKKVWTLKKEYEKYSRIIGHTPTTLIVDPTVAPDPEFYDYKEEPYYSKIPKGSIVEFANKIYKEVVSYERGYFRTVCDTNVHQSYPAKSLIRIVELAKE